ncbi:hypothetical protein pdam_00022671, partial [Pocillopora damicornis]
FLSPGSLKCGISFVEGTTSDGSIKIKSSLTICTLCTPYPTMFDLELEWTVGVGDRGRHLLAKITPALQANIVSVFPGRPFLSDIYIDSVERKVDHMSVVWVSSLVAWFSKLSGREFGYLPFQVKGCRELIQNFPTSLNTTVAPLANSTLLFLWARDNRRWNKGSGLVRGSTSRFLQTGDATESSIDACSQKQSPSSLQKDLATIKPEINPIKIDKGNRQKHRNFIKV